MEHLSFEKIFTQKITGAWLTDKNISLGVLRLDKIHTTISGNKWFKLKYFLKDAAQKNSKTIATFGGPYSNHIVATAYACSVSGFNSIGIIRGEEPKNLSHTLITAKEFGMKIYFTKRNEFKNFDKNKFPNACWINEGGYGDFGVEGAKEILNLAENKNQYSHIFCSVGTGTTLAGIIQSSNEDQKIIGISIMKNNLSLENEIKNLLHEDYYKNFTIIHDYHFGGYAKYTKQLIDSMNETFALHALPTDFVYTAKTFFAIKNMVEENKISNGSNILMIHTGGLQGNLSLPKSALQF